jgi:lysophospholipid acyltransferase (LPLAT)-like uncharacterized protein
MKLRLEHPAWRRLAPKLAKILANTYLRTCPQEVSAHPEALALVDSGRPVLFTTWHCHLLAPLFYLHRRYGRQLHMALMASPSRDGEFIAEVTRGLGFIVYAGSHRKGGVQALQAIAEYMRHGGNGGIIADGSRGPVRVAQKGVLFLAREAQAPILPVGVAASRKLTLNTWDRFELPLPFSRLAILVEEPLWVPPDRRGASLEPLRQELENRLNRLFSLSQQYF